MTTDPAAGVVLRRLLGDGWQPPVPWAHLPAVPVPVGVLVPTQWPHYSPCQLTRQRVTSPAAADPAVRLVGWQRRLFIWDGHHRVAGRLRRGARTVQAHVWTLTPEGSP